MKLANLVKARRTLWEYAQEKVPAKLAYKIMKFVKSTSDEVDFYEDKVKEILSKYAEKDANGEPIIDGSYIKIKEPGAQENCVKELNAVGGIDVEAPQIKFSLRELEKLNLSALEMFDLDEFIVAEE